MKNWKKQYRDIFEGANTSTRMTDAQISFIEELLKNAHQNERKKVVEEVELKIRKQIMRDMGVVFVDWNAEPKGAENQPNYSQRVRHDNEKSLAQLKGE